MNDTHRPITKDLLEWQKWLEGRESEKLAALVEEVEQLRRFNPWSSKQQAELATLRAENERLRAMMDKQAKEVVAELEGATDIYQENVATIAALRAENEALRGALEAITRECDALHKGPVAAKIARAALQEE